MITFVKAFAVVMLMGFGIATGLLLTSPEQSTSSYIYGSKRVEPSNDRVIQIDHFNAAQRGKTLTGLMTELQAAEPSVTRSSITEVTKAYAGAVGINPSAALPIPSLLLVHIDGDKVVSINGYS